MERTKLVRVDGYKNRKRLTVYAGLVHHRGNEKPHFSVTGEVTTNNGGYVAGGCIHDEILAAFPDLAPLVALHLSDIDGAPIHAIANGWYFLAGYLGARRGAEYIDDSGEALAHFAEHIRRSTDEASRLASYLVGSTVRGLDDADRLYDAWVFYADTFLRPQWAAQAQAAIEKFGLTVTSR